jgi:hypothetical protein
MSIYDWIGIGVIALVIVGVLILLNQITKPYDVKTEEEFQKRRKESAGMMVAGLKGLQQILDPAGKEGSHRPTGSTARIVRRSRRGRRSARSGS